MFSISGNIFGLLVVLAAASAAPARRTGEAWKNRCGKIGSISSSERRLLDLWNGKEQQWEAIRTSYNSVMNNFEYNDYSGTIYKGLADQDFNHNDDPWLPTIKDIKSAERLGNVKCDEAKKHLSELHTNLQKCVDAFDIIEKQEDIESNQRKLGSTKDLLIAMLCTNLPKDSNTVKYSKMPDDSFNLTDGTYIILRNWGIVKRCKAYLDVWKDVFSCK